MYYVYAHREDGETVYVGKGKFGRAWDVERGRNASHKEWLIQHTPFVDVEIIAHDLLEVEAKNLESQLITSLKPRFNRTGNPDYTYHKAGGGDMSHINSTHIECEHCKRSFRPGMYARWHGDKCKEKHNG